MMTALKYGTNASMKELNSKLTKNLRENMKNHENQS